MRLIIHERTKRTMFGLWCVTWLVVLVASLWPLQQMPFGLPDKLVHFTCYAAMTSAAATFCHEVRGLLRWHWLAVVVRPLRRAAA